MPEDTGELIRIEGGIITGGKVVFDDPNLFTELPKISILPVTSRIVSVSLINRTTQEFTYKVMAKIGWWRWRNRTTTIPVIWLAIQEK